VLSRTHRKYVQNVLIGAAAVVFLGARIVPGAEKDGPLTAAAKAFVTGSVPADSTDSVTAESSAASRAVASKVRAAVTALASRVRPLSTPTALEAAFGSYFAYRAAHPDEVKKPYLYFVDYGLPSTAARGYLFDMSSLKVIDGPFTVAHGRGSSTSQFGVPTHFSNVSGSEATSLGLYVAEGTYAFHGKSGGHPYSSIGLKLMGVSEGYNDNALARRVVAHGAPYVTPTKAGRSEGCPAVEQSRARTLLPKLANGGMVFLFAPDESWLAGDPWVVAGDV
jgi:L,D-transpeptidase-like protein